jgi:hypothetical protein
VDVVSQYAFGTAPLVFGNLLGQSIQDGLISSGFDAAVSLNTEGYPMYLKMTPVSGFTRKAIVAGGRKPKEIPEFSLIRLPYTCVCRRYQ